ncbi:MAG: (2Fe-2S)-binding protein [Candidatus Hydrothermae bacterium]|nr:(2Fe-2S)-binding protein [Candidatus Hydrothermae bacterium]
MERKIVLQVNGEEYEVFVDPAKPLLNVLRDEFGLTGPKEGCGKGECGACTVLLDGKPVPSCLVLVGQAEGHTIQTIEGLDPDDPLIRAFADEGAVQCGFCTPGFIMAAKALLERNPDPSTEEIKEALSGNLCRCTGYAKIIRAVKRAAAVLQVERR